MCAELVACWQTLNFLTLQTLENTFLKRFGQPEIKQTIAFENVHDSSQRFGTPSVKKNPDCTTEASF